MRAKIFILAAAFSALSTTGVSAACVSNINGGTTLNEGECYRHNTGVAVGCHGGQLGPVQGTTNKCDAWVKVDRQPAGNMSTAPTDPSRGGKENAFSSRSATNQK